MAAERALLREALEHHQAGRLERAERLYRRVLARDPGNADALQFLGILCHQRGACGEAERLVRRAIAARPEVAAYHDNLGAILEATGRAGEALECYRRAEALEPGDPDRGFNRGVALAALGRLDEAEAALREALRRRPGDGAAHDRLGSVLRRQGRAGEALAEHRAALAVEPDNPGFHLQLGHALAALGEHREAAAAYRRALALAPGDGAAHLHLGAALRALGDLAGAERSLRRALALGAPPPGARVALAGLLEEQRPGEALAVLLAGWPEERADPGLRRALAALLRRRAPQAPVARLGELVESLLEEGDATAQELAAAGYAQVRLRHRLAGDDPQRLEAALPALAGDRLLGSLLTRAVNCDPLLEPALGGLRRLLAGRCAERGRVRALAAALARQAFLNEYLWPASSAEQAACARRAVRLEAAIAGGAAPGAIAADLIAQALYRPLAALPGAAALAARAEEARGALEPALAGLLDACLHAPLAEQAIAAALPALTPIEDPTSRAVRAHYEANPYPRWLEAPAGRAEDYASFLERRYPGFRAPDWLRAPVRVLVAGCGTGQEAVAAARMRPGCEVLAVDLSRASLAYGARMAAAQGLAGRLRFAQADLLGLPALGERFAVIESTGVLHHLAEPLAGWRALVECLRPGGVIKVGLYSRRARAVINRARERIAARGLAPSPEAIRALRAELLAEGRDGPLGELLASEDFYSLSGCRDLLFHCCEHQFTWAEVADAVAALGLEVIGVEAADAGVLERYRQAHPHDPRGADLAAWERFERAHPQAFTAMYVFWCRRPG